MLIDNKIDRYPDDGYDIKTVWDFINEFSGRKSGQTGNLDIVTGYFTIRALSKLYHEIPEEDNFRIVSSELVKLDEDENNIIDLLNEDRDIDSVIRLDECADDAKAFLRRNNVQIKAIVRAFCHAKAYMFRNNNARNDSFYLSGSSNLTDAGLGLKESSNVELNSGKPTKLSDNDYKEICKWFEDIWQMAADEIPSDPKNPKSEKVSVKDYFIKMIDEYFRKYTPEEIYYKILFELFNADLDLDGGIEHHQDMSLLQTSVIWKTLFNYQQKGVISLIKMLRKYNGAILADAVGLGKTFSALAVIKYFQIQNYTTVLLCPKKLEQNWTQYLKGAGSRFDKDELDYAVRFHTDCQGSRLQDAYDTFKLDYLQHRQKILLVIDESHNLRNEKSNRYKTLLEQLIQTIPNVENRDVKILMLSATPINTGFNDIKGQFNLIGHGKDDAFNTPDFGVESLKNTFRTIQAKYTEWCKEEGRTIGSFIRMLNGTPKFFNLTDKLIVARTRQLIEKTLGENLGFPKKSAPLNVYQGVDHFGNFSSAEEIYSAFESLSLTAYQPSIFLHDSRKDARKEAAADWDDDVNREMFLVKMMGILFMKRLESSWFACKATVKKVLDVHTETLDKVVAFKDNKTDSIIRHGVEVDEDDDDLDDEYVGRRQIKVSDIKNLGGFEKGLRHDVNQLKKIYAGLEDFEKKYRAKEEADLKLDRLVDILNEKKHAANKKVVIFTAYSDTARFLFDELTARGFDRVATASGLCINSTGRHSKQNFTEILQSFAPYSKLYKELDWSSMYEEAKLNRARYYNDEKQRWDVKYEKWLQLLPTYRSKFAGLVHDGIDILIATDCLSEGQNLQDADMQINYDIHWNPVRLIQRFGRIDRIGSPNKEIRCVNFWPAESFEQYLHLETRIQNRMSIMSVVGVEDMKLNDQYNQMVADNPLKDKNADRLLEELQNNSISDIESPRTLSLKDFSFEVYRQDLVEYFERHKDVFRKMPNGIFSGFVHTDDLFEHIPESLVAVVGSPHREPGSTKPYTEIYLMCQPVDGKLPADYKELNRADVLDFLRKNKYSERFVPDWIEKHDTERIDRLKNIMQQWMRQKAPQQALTNIKDKLRSRTIKRNTDTQLLEEKFRMENFDLIVWEYVSKNS